MSSDSCIYGVDLSGEITPTKVRDAIVKCFFQAQKELMEYMEKTTDLSTESIEDFNVNIIIENAFEEVGGDFNNPTKETLNQVILKLMESAKDAFRETEIIEKHAGEIKQLIDKLDQS